MNRIKDICVYVNYGYEDTAMLHAAARLSADQNAHLTAIYAVQPPSTYYGVAIDGTVPQILIDRYVEDMAAHEAKHREIFEATNEKFGVKATWYSEHGYPENVATRWFRYADLCFVAQPRADDTSAIRSELNAIILHSGRPVIVVPDGTDTDNLRDHILVCWDGGKEAARAVHDALPLLKQAKSVEVFMIESHNKPNMLSTGVSLGQHLARHDVTVESSTIRPDKKSTGELILGRAAAINADMIVAGAYGHARAREYIFGGVTRTLLEKSELPVFMSH